MLLALEPSPVRFGEAPALATAPFQDLHHDPADQQDGRDLEEQEHGETEGELEHDADDAQNHPRHDDRSETDREEGEECADHVSLPVLTDASGP